MGVNLRRIGPNLLLAAIALITLCVLLFLVEVTVRHFHPSFGEQFQIEGEWDKATHFDSELGWFNDANNQEYQIDNRGFRQSGSVSPLEEFLSIVVLGDSTTFGVGVNASQTFVSHLNRQFPDIAFINAGVSGYSTIQEYLLLRRIFDDIRPTQVILVYYYNDCMDNLMYMEGYPRPLLTFEAGEYSLINYPLGVPLWRRILHDLSKKSYLFNLIVRTKTEREIRQFREELLNLNTSNVAQEYIPLTGETHQRCLPVTEEALRMLDRFTKEKGVDFTVFLQPDFVTFSLNSEELFAKLPTCPEIYVLPRVLLSLDEAQAASHMYPHLVEFGKKEGIPIFDLTAPLYEKYLARAAGDEAAPVFFGDIAHLSPEGHEAMAEIIADTMGESFQPVGGGLSQSFE